MAMNGTALGDRIAALITDSDAPAEAKQQIKTLWEKIGAEIVKEVKNAEITIPSESVIISVAGQATGTPNPSPISNDIS